MNISIYSASELTITATPHDNSTAWITIREGENGLDIFFDPRNPKKLHDLRAAVDKLLEVPEVTPEPLGHGLLTGTAFPENFEPEIDKIDDATPF